MKGFGQEHPSVFSGKDIDIVKPGYWTHQAIFGQNIFISLLGGEEGAKSFNLQKRTKQSLCV